MTDIGPSPEPQQPVEPLVPQVRFVQLCSHNNRLLGLGTDGSIWWGSWDGTKDAQGDYHVTWVLVWDGPPTEITPLPSPQEPPQEGGEAEPLDVNVPEVSI